MCVDTASERITALGHDLFSIALKCAGGFFLNVQGNVVLPGNSHCIKRKFSNLFDMEIINANAKSIPNNFQD